MGFCFVCLNDFWWPADYRRGNKLFMERHKWKTKYKANSGYSKAGQLKRKITLDAKELEGVYFKRSYGTSAWIELYRLIWYDQVNERFRLSGVGHFNPYVGYYGIQNAAVKEYEKALVGHVRALRHETETLTTGPYSFMQFSWWHYTTQLSENTQEEFISAHWSSLPLAMHMSCWKLAQWVMGPALLDHDKNLELFAGVILKLILHQSHLWYDSEKRVHYDLSGDPYRIPQVKQLIARSKEEKKEKEKRQRHSEEKRKAKPRSSQLSRLPIEVFEMTLDYLTVREILKLEDALLIVLADGYWRRRASWDLVEINELSGEEETIDWRYLCTHLDRMIRRDEAFDNRNHVTRILRDHVKPEFLRILEEGDHPSLEQIIVEYQQEKGNMDMDG